MLSNKLLRKHLWVLLFIFLNPVVMLAFQFLVIAQGDEPEISENRKPVTRQSAPQLLTQALDKAEVNYNTSKITGKASYYANYFHRRRTANGELYDKEIYSAAHRSLPFGSIVKVTNINSDRAILVRINDRGPFTKRKVVDLSLAAAKAIGAMGNPQVKLEYFASKEQRSSTEDTFYAYSLEQSPLSANKRAFLFVDSTKIFQAAVEKLQSLAFEQPGANYYLAVNSRESSAHYYIVKLNETNIEFVNRRP
ncbi:MAG: septal ring lytic transglycosylase RlpA family protein [Chloroflexota bacterium]